MQTDVSPKSRLAAGLLCFFFGWLGVHRFYVGKVGTAILMVLTIGGFGVWATIDLIFIIVGAFRYAVQPEMMIDAGKAYLVRMGLLDGPGTYSLSDAHTSWVGEAEGDEAGYNAKGLGDVNGDGLSDLIVSGWQLNIPSGSGKVWVLLNP